jgi:hypothetical protein
MDRFRDLPGVGRFIIIAVAFGVFAVCGLACATSYNAIYRLVGMLGLYENGITKAFPGMLDIAFIIAEMAAMLGGIMRAVTGSRDVSAGWPYTTMLVCGICTIAFNVAHAYLIGGANDPLTWWRMGVSALPPILMIVSFQVLIAIVKWVMLRLGRALNSQMAMAHGNGHLPSSTGIQSPQNGLTQSGVKAAIEGYLSTLSDDQLQLMTDSQLVDDMGARGVVTSRQYSGRVLGEFRAPTNAIGARRNGRRKR